MPVLQKCLNFDYSSCQFHRTTVRFSSEEISVTLTEYIRLCLVPSCCEKVKNYLRIHMDENLKTVNWSVFKNLRLLSFDTYILGTTLQHLGHYECLKNIKINFRNFFTLTVLSSNSCLQSCFFYWKDPLKTTFAFLWHFLQRELHFKPYKLQIFNLHLSLWKYCSVVLERQLQYHTYIIFMNILKSSVWFCILLL